MPWGCFPGPETMRVLLELHRHLSAARHPRHRQQRLGALEAAVGTIAGGRGGGGRDRRGGASCTAAAVAAAAVGRRGVGPTTEPAALR